MCDYRDAAATQAVRWLTT